MVKATLIPFRKTIIVARLTFCFSITFGSDIKGASRKTTRNTGRLAVFFSFPIPEISED